MTAAVVTGRREATGPYFSNAVMCFTNAALVLGAGQNAPHRFPRQVQAVCHTRHAALPPPTCMSRHPNGRWSTVASALTHHRGSALQNLQKI